MARVKPNVTELLIDDPENGRSIILRGGDEVPQWALDIYSNPRLIDFN